MRQKKEFERAIINGVLKWCSIPSEKCIDSERPDFVVNSNENGVIGIEVVLYLNPRHAESDCVLTETIFDYKNELDIKLGRHCYVSVHFRDRAKLLDYNIKSKKEQIYKEIDYCIFEKEKSLDNEFIQDVVVYQIEGLTETFITSVYSYWLDSVDECFLRDIIANKENKLKDYKLEDKNSNISEWWLVVFDPGVEHIDILKFQPSNGLQSEYDCVFLVDWSNVLRIK